MRVDQEASLLELASSVSDGVPVDWKQIEAGAPDDSIRRRHSALKTVAAIAELHRSASSGPSAGESRVWGHLEILGKIGNGAFGEVYRAWDQDLRREVALKIASSGGKRQVAAMKEARAMARVKHTNVVTIYGVDRQGDQVGLWMDLIRGRTLEAILKDQGPLGGREAALVGIELCRALAAVHAEHLLHGDVKAQNVMREEGGRIVLMDFGLVRNAEDAASRQGGWVGTPVYMAPELFRSERPSVRSDIFALGVLLYHLVTGAFPTSKGARDTAQYAGSAKLLHDLRPDLPENFVQLIERALSPEPADRFSSAGDMLSALSSALGSERQPVPVVSPVASLFKRVLAPLLALFGVIALALLFMQSAFFSSALDRVRAIAPTSRVEASIAVLPFENLSSTPDTDYLSEGIADAVTSRLTRVKTLRVVIAESNALRKLKAHDDVSGIARELRVGTLLAGTVRKTGDTIRISVKLIDPETKSYLWSETYDKSLASVLDIGAEISQAVVPRLAKQFAGMQLPDRTRSPTADAGAFHLYLKGRYHWNKRTPEEIKKAIGYFRDAVKADPAFALAYSGLADCYSTLVDFGNLPAAEGMPEAKRAAVRARELNDSLAEAHTSVAYVSALYDWDWAAAESGFLRALQLNPSYAMAHIWYARFLTKIAHADGAIVEAKRAVDLDPLSLPVNNALGADYYFARRYGEAREQLLKTLELEDKFMPAHFWLGRVYIRQGKFAEALVESKTAAAIVGEDQQLPQLLAAEAYALSGRRADALAILREWETRRSQSSSVAPSSFALVYSSLGEKELALEWLNRAYAERDSSLLTAQAHPSYDWLRSDSHFQEIFKRMGLPFRSIRKPGSSY